MRNSRADPRIPAFARKGKNLFVPVLFGPPLFFSMGLFPDPMKKNIGKRAKKLTGCFGTVGSAIFLSNPARHGIETGAAARGNPYFAALVTKPETGFVPMFAAAAFFASPGNFSSPPPETRRKVRTKSSRLCKLLPRPKENRLPEMEALRPHLSQILGLHQNPVPGEGRPPQETFARPFRTASRTSAKLPSASAVLTRGAAYAWDSQKI
nr:hypothetical protein [Bacillaceae bacterium]